MVVHTNMARFSISQLADPCLTGAAPGKPGGVVRLSALRAQSARHAFQAAKGSFHFPPRRSFAQRLAVCNTQLVPALSAQFSFGLVVVPERPAGASGSHRLALVVVVVASSSGCFPRVRSTAAVACRAQTALARTVAAAGRVSGVGATPNSTRHQNRENPGYAASQLATYHFGP